MSSALALAAYSTAWRLALPLVFARFWWRGLKEPAYRSGWRQRLGWWRQPDEDSSAARPLIWLHAVSLGETRAAKPLIEALRREIPGMRLLLTTGTATGWQAGQEILQGGDRHGWIPLDTPGACRRFLRANRPDVGVLMETETWPNLLRAAREHRLPVLMANARLSARSLAKGQRWSALMRPMLQGLSQVLAQTAGDALRFQLAGLEADRVKVCGNLKFDLQPDAALLERGASWHQALAPQARRVVLAASWREGEDEPLLKAWAQHARASTQRPLLLWVPRHPQRFDEVAAMIARGGFSLARRSHWSAEEPTPEAAHADVWLGDSMGEMPVYYAAADVALLGGSFAPLGGQNLIEAAACACPVLMGPHTFNFLDAADLAEQAGAARRLMDLDEAVRQALALDQAQLQAMRLAAKAYSAEHGGATQCMARFIRDAWASACAETGRRI